MKLVCQVEFGIEIHEVYHGWDLGRVSVRCLHAGHASVIG